MSNNSHKKYIISLNTHMIIALILLFFTGFGMLILSIVFIIKITNSTNQIGFSISFLISIFLVLLIIGIILIMLSVFQSIGLISRIKKILDKAIETETIHMSETGAVIQTNTVQTVNSANIGVGGSLHIIRPPMPKSSENSVESVSNVSKSKSSTEIHPDAKKSSLSISANTNASTSIVSKVPGSGGDLMSVDDGLKFIVDRYNSEKVKSSFKDWNNTLMMNFKDLGKSYLYTINGDQGIELKEGVDESAAVQVTMDSEIFQKMMSKQINPIKAYSSGGLEVKGEMKNMLKLKKLMF